MTTVELNAPMRPAANQSAVRAVTVVMGTVVGLTFLFGFGNVLNLARQLGVPIWVGTRHLALHDAMPATCCPPGGC